MDVIMELVERLQTEPALALTSIIVVALILFLGMLGLSHIMEDRVGSKKKSSTSKSKSKAAAPAGTPTKSKGTPRKADKEEVVGIIETPAGKRSTRQRHAPQGFDPSFR